MNMRSAIRHAVLLAVIALRPAAAQTSAFARLIDRLSEPPGSFTGDNLVSNETSYLHILPDLKARGVHGGAYIGVGPEQNFSYIAEIEPSIAFVIDIRRDNLLLQLLFKAMFEESTSRTEYLCLLYGRPVPPDVLVYRASGAPGVLEYIEKVAFDSAVHERQHAALITRIERDGVALSGDDKATLKRFHDSFAREGLNLKFTIPRPTRNYPTVRRLYLETDLMGRQVSYVASEERWQRVRSLEVANKVIPLVGDLAGPKTIRAIGQYLTETHEVVSAYYVSNVELYLWRDRVLGNYANNVRALPAAPNAVIIRAWFSQGGNGLSTSMPGHFSTQLVQPFARFFTLMEHAATLQYLELIDDPWTRRN
jgi:hypothetical protein